MKKIFFALFSIGILSANAQQPETVYSVAREQRSMDWYSTQQKLWKEETVKNKLNANAWYNYYSATRAMKNSCYNDQDPVASLKQKETLIKQANQIVEEAYKAIPTSFEANYLKWWNGNNDPVLLQYLQKAYEIDPSDVRTYDDLMIQAVLNRDQNQFKKFSNQLYLANDLPASLLNWGYNVLAELEQNAIVFTAGDNDTYACWIVQGAKNFRTDVTVINTYLIQEEDYRTKLFEELHLPTLKLNTHAKTEAEKTKNNSLIFEHILKNTAGIPVYVATTAIDAFKTSYDSSLYLTGLTYKYSNSNVDNLSLIQRNYEKNYLLDYLDQQFSFHRMDQHASYFDATYLPSMLTLFTHYETIGQNQLAEKLKKRIETIAEKTGNQAEILKIIHSK